jgi:hypothetical protein
MLRVHATFIAAAMAAAMRSVQGITRNQNVKTGGIRKKTEEIVAALAPGNGLPIDQYQHKLCIKCR